MKSEEHRKSIATCDKELCEESEFDSELRVGGRRQCYTGGSIVVEDIRSTFASTEYLRCLNRNCCGHCKRWQKPKHQLYQCVVIIILILILLHNGLESDL